VTLKILLGVAIGVVTLGAVVGVTVPASAAQAASPFCPNGCVGSRVEDTNCGVDKYPVVSARVRDLDATDYSPADMWYSPLCKTVWGEYSPKNSDQVRYIQLWAQDEYGGKNTLPYQGASQSSDFQETTMVSSSGSIKFCVTGIPDGDPDLDDFNKPYNNCSGWF
jgi:hypothetical protein